MLFPLIALSLVGLLVGILVNLLADDLPHYRRPRAPRYPDGTPRSPVAWSGVLAFLTGRRASPGGARLSWRYPLAEIGTAALMVLVALVTADNARVTDIQRAFYFFYMALFVLITVIDIEHRLILFSVIIPSSALALVAAALNPPGTRPALGEALGGAALGFGVFFMLYLGGILFSYLVAKSRGEELPEVAFGYGDVMLAMLCGLILGWQALIFAMFITVFLGALGALIYLIGRSFTGRYDMFTPLPYGPYIVIGTLIMLLFSDQVRDTLWRL